MKRGFLLKAAEKEEAASDEGIRELQPPKSTPLVPQTTMPQLSKSLDDIPPEFRLPFGNLTEEQKALPEDYDKNSANSVFVERDPARTDLPPGELLFTAIPHIDDGHGSTEWIINDAYAKAKVLKTPGYPSRPPKPHRPDLHEVRMTPDMGQGVFAKHNIKRGELIFSERPLLVAPNWTSARAKEHYSWYQAQQVQMFEFEKLLSFAVQRMREKERALYMALHNAHTADGTGPLLGIMRTNAFELCDLGMGGPLDYSAVCNLGSRINHSCISNVDYKFKASSFSFQFIAVRDIKAGEQLFYSYCLPNKTKAERQAELARYGISCNCPACVNATPATDKLRKTFTDQVARLNAWVEQPDWNGDPLVCALLLEADMVAEGLDPVLSFFSLLVVIYVAYLRMERGAEMATYQKRLEEYHKIHELDHILNAMIMIYHQRCRLQPLYC